MGMLQQLVILGSNQGENSTMTTFAGRAADYLQQQYEFYTNPDNMMAAVQASSSVPYRDSIMQAKSACSDDAILDRCALLSVCL